jgi:hypothetical protein
MNINQRIIKFRFIVLMIINSFIIINWNKMNYLIKFVQTMILFFFLQNIKKFTKLILKNLKLHLYLRQIIKQKLKS